MNLTIEYSLKVTIKRALEDCKDQDWMQSNGAKLALEREVLHVLRRLDGDADCEVTEHRIVDDDGEPIELSERTLYETGLCCLRAHAMMNTKMPWTCDCPCHKQAVGE